MCIWYLNFTFAIPCQKKGVEEEEETVELSRWHRVIWDNTTHGEN